MAAVRRGGDAPGVVVRGGNARTREAGGVVVTPCSYYNTDKNYATIEDRTTDDKQINYKVDPG